LLGIKFRLRRQFNGIPRDVPSAQNSLALDAVSNEHVDEKDNNSSSCSNYEENVRAQTFCLIVLLEAGSILALN